MKLVTSLRALLAKGTLFASIVALIGAFSVSATTAAEMTLKLAGVVPVEHFGNKVLEDIKADIEAADVGLDGLLPAMQALAAGRLAGKVLVQPR